MPLLDEDWGFFMKLFLWFCGSELPNSPYFLFIYFYYVLLMANKPMQWSFAGRNWRLSASPPRQIICGFLITTFCLFLHIWLVGCRHCGYCCVMIIPNLNRSRPSRVRTRDTMLSWMLLHIVGEWKIVMASRSSESFL